jgi:hypothetical protein
LLESPFHAEAEKGEEVGVWRRRLSRNGSRLA